MKILGIHKCRTKKCVYSRCHCITNNGGVIRIDKDDGTINIDYETYQTLASKTAFFCCYYACACTEQPWSAYDVSCIGGLVPGELYDVDTIENIQLEWPVRFYYEYFAKFIIRTDFLNGPIINYVVDCVQNNKNVNVERYAALLRRALDIGVDNCIIYHV